MQKNSLTNPGLKNSWGFIITLAGLLAIGFVSLYSASTVDSYRVAGTTTYYIIHQFTFGLILGLMAFFLGWKVPYRLWHKYLGLVVVVALLSLLAVKISSLGISSGGATRWLNLGIFTFQPSELAKIALIFYLASWAEKKESRINDFYFGLLPPIVVTGLLCFLILWQPDLGSALVLGGIAASMLFTAGISWKYFFWSALTSIVFLAGFVHFEPYRANRINAFLNPQDDPKGISYHINQAMLAVGSGKFWGYGYGLSRQKHNYLPEVMNDSIFAVTAEELGFLRSSGILALYTAFILSMASIAKSAKDRFGKMLAFGIMSWIAIQVIINIAAMLRLVPLTGIPLPFFSYGSSALIMNMFAAGIIMSIAKNSK